MSENVETRCLETVKYIQANLKELCENITVGEVFYFDSLLFWSFHAG